METIWTWQTTAGICCAALIVAVMLGLALARFATRTRRRRPWQTPHGDPFVTLELQMRLGKVSERLRVLTGADGGFASAHHHRATQAAYDSLLAEACRLAGVESSAPYLSARSVTTGDRLLRELELSSRGWTW
ncbi:MAG: hypothetical protein FWD83_02825 [Promicromonosporaceae bacterium]|nr:hypothetical protein [Promicromonosporaceae bacterium]